MQRTRYRREVLEFILGPANAEPAIAGEGALVLRWPCGCIASGTDPDVLTIEPCDEHATEFEGDESD